jgi:hypothetical protein
MHLVNTRRLVEDLAHGRVSERDKAYYLLVGLIFYILVGYSTLIFANQGRTWLGAFEAFMLVMIAVLGVQSSFQAGGGDTNTHFIVDFTCLLVPLSIKVYAAVWGLYWLFVWAYYAVAATGVEFESEGTARAVRFLSMHAGWFMTLLAVLVTQAAFFLRMRVHMESLAELREASNSLMQPTGRERPAAD